MEILEELDSQRSWRAVTSAFELMMPESWSGYIVYGGARHWVEPGMLFCPGPGDTFEILRAQAPGSFRMLVLEREALVSLLAEQRLLPESLPLHRIMRDAPVKLTMALRRFLDDMRLEAPTSRLLSSWHDLGVVLTTQLGTASGKTRPAENPEAAERLCELIHAGLDETLDLGTFSRESGLSRFQVLRAFKRAYGLPPHTYQLCYRIAQAKRLLCMGHRPAYVATELGFSDQSHMNRHFKRLLGVTPREYAKGAAAAAAVSAWPNGERLQRKRAVPVRLSSTQL